MCYDLLSYFLQCNLFSHSDHYFLYRQMINFLFNLMKSIVPILLNCIHKNHLTRLSVIFFAICLSSCGTVQFYKETDKPIFYSNKKNAANTEVSDSLNVLTFNIKEAQKIDLAITELKEFEKSKSIDVYLLQEMDENGAATIAKELHLNYLYIPIVYNTMIKKNIGNAILTKGTIELPVKLVLPHSKWINNRRRHATVGEVNIHQKKILVYSVHTETSSMRREYRMDQVDTIIEHAKTQFPNYNYILIGGDFNTLYAKDRKRIIEKFSNNGFNCATDTIGYTAKALMGLIKPHLDYIFCKGLNVINADKITTSKASDHFPVFATLKWR